MMEKAILGVNLDGTTLYVGKVRGDRLVSRFFRRITHDASEKVVLEEVFKSIDRIIGSDVEGIGFGVPSVIDVAKGIVYSVQHIPSWKEVHLKEILEQRYGIPAHINNDANAFAAGEFHFGEGRGYQNLVGVIVGVGLGVGIMFNGRLCMGGNCGAGEIGRIPYLDGTFESYCSRQFFEKKSPMQELLLRSRAERGDPEACRIYREFGEHLGNVMLTVLYAYDPEVIVFGGDLSGAYPLFRETLAETVKKKFTFEHSLSRLMVSTTESKSDRAALGAAAIYLDSVESEKERKRQAAKEA
jgi:glucokinase